MKKIALTLFFVFLLIKVFADYTGTINISLSDVSYQKKNSFDLVSIKDYTFMQNPGAPHLPQKLLLFIIPTDKRVSNVVINNYSEVELPGSVNIFPAQESQVGAAPPIGFTQPDPGIYQSNSFYPIDTFKSDYTSSILGAKIYHLYFNPIKYNPVTGRVILITSITYTLVYENDPVQFQQPSVVYTKDFFENQSLLMNLIENQDEILTKYTPNVSATFARNLQANTIPIQNEIVPYIIITNNNLQDNFQDLANYLTSTGLPTIVYAVDGPNSIINSIPCLDEVCNDNQQKIRNLIKTLWSNNGLKYVLLGGDADVVPCRRAVISHFDNTSISSQPGYAYGTQTPTDMYYACLENNPGPDWDSNNNGNYGESNWATDGMTYCNQVGGNLDMADITPDIRIGRIPVSSETEASEFIAKYLEYVNPGQSVIQNINGENLNTLMFSQDISGIYSYQVEDYLPQVIEPSMLLTKLYHLVNGLPVNEKQQVKDALQGTLFNKKFGIVIGHGHGTSTTFGACSDNDYMSVNEMGTILGSRRQILLSHHCHTANFGYPSDCIADKYLKNYNGGVAYMGQSNFGIMPDNVDFTKFFLYRLLNNGYNNINYYRIGDAYFLTKVNPLSYNYSLGHDFISRWIFFATNLLAEPSMPVWTNTPSNFTVTVSPSGSVNNFVRITVTAGAYSENVKVTITKDGCSTPLYYDIFATNEEFLNAGEVKNFDFNINPSCNGNLKIMVTGRNYWPKTINLTVNTSSKYIIAESYTVIDNPVGDNDGITDAGESISLSTVFKNPNSTYVTGAQAVLSCSSPYIIITSSPITIGNLAGGSSVTNNMNFSISNNCPDNTLVEFTLTYTYTGTPTPPSTIQKFYILIHAAVLQYYCNYYILSGTDNTINQGEAVKNRVVLYNSGSAEARQITATLNSPSPVGSYTPSSVNLSGISIPSHEYYPIEFTQQFTNNSNPYNNFTLNTTSSFMPNFSQTFNLLRTGLPQNFPSAVYYPNTNSIKFKWYTIANCRGYRLYLRTATTTVAEINIFDDEINTYEFTSLTPNTNYFFNISYFDGTTGNESIKSPDVPARTTPPLHTGWPVNFNSGSVITPFSAFDIDNDNKKEIFFGINGSTNSNGFACRKEDGNKFFSTPTNGFISFNIKKVYVPAFGDFDYDGKPEIVTEYDPSGIHSYKIYKQQSGNNNPFLFHSITGIGGDNSLGTTIADINYDGKLDIFGALKFINLHKIFKNIGIDNSNIEINSNPFLFNEKEKAAVADINNDGYKEIVICSGDGLFIWNYDGSNYGNSNPYFSNQAYDMGSVPVIADIDNDGVKDILFLLSTTNASTARLCAVNASGSSPIFLNGFTLTSQYNTIDINSSNIILPNIAIGDLNNDSKPEIICGSQNIIKIWNWQGQYFISPISVGGLNEKTDMYVLTPLIADIDGDNDMEIIMPSSDDNLIHAFHHYGVRVDGWPLPYGGKNTPCIADIDGDNKIELVSGDYENIYMWDLEGNPSKVEWGYFHADPQNTGVYLPACNRIESAWHVIQTTGSMPTGEFHKNIRITGTNTVATLTGGLYMPQGSVIIVEQSCTLHLSTNSLLAGICTPYKWQGKIIVKSGGILRVSNSAALNLLAGSQLEVQDGGTAIIESTGALDFQGGIITLTGSNALLNIAGILNIGASKNFTFTGTGFVKFSSTVTNANNIVAGTGSQMTLNGKNMFSHKVLEVAQDQLWLPTNLTSLNISSGKVVFSHNSGKIKQQTSPGTPTAINFQNVKLTNDLTIRTNYIGLYLLNGNNITIDNCIFTNGLIGIYGYFATTGTTLNVAGANFINCNTGISLNGGSFVIGSSIFDNCNDGLVTSATEGASTITGSVFKNSSSLGINYNGQSAAHITMENCQAFGNSGGGVSLNGGFNAYIKCCQIYGHSTTWGIYKVNGYLLINSTKGHNDLSGNKYPVYLNSVLNIYLNGGFNKLIHSTGGYDIYGSLNRTFGTIAANNNEWKSPNGAPTYNVDYQVSKVGSNPLQYFTFSDGSPQLYNTTGCSGGGTQMSMQSPEVLSSSVSTITTETLGTVPLNDAVNSAESDINTDNYSGAFSKLSEILFAKIKKPNQNDEYWLDLAYSYFNIVTEKMKKNSLMNANQAIKMLSVIDDQISKNNNNYHRKFAKNLDKALAYRLIGRQSLAVEIIEDMRSWVLPEDVETLQNWYCVNKIESDLLSGLISIEEADVRSQTGVCDPIINQRLINNNGSEQDEAIESVLNENINMGCSIEVVPNPVTSTSIITTTVNEKVTNAELHVVSSQGVTVKTYKVTNRVTSIEIRNTDLSSGVYWLQLFVNGIPEKIKKFITIK